MPDSETAPLLHAVMTETLTIPQQLYDAMLQQLLDAVPLEACGLLAGVEGHVRRLYPIENRLHSPVAYEMEPHQQLQAMLQMEEAGLQLLAIYHSHPTGPQTPSATDVDQSFYPGVAYIIISLARPFDPVARAFQIDAASARRYYEIALKIV